VPQTHKRSTRARLVDPLPLATGSPGVRRYPNLPTRAFPRILTMARPMVESQRLRQRTVTLCPPLPNFSGVRRTVESKRRPICRVLQM